jgi:hypothetical protein
MAQENLLREVDEELRRDRMRDLWRRYGPILIAAAVGVVLIVAVSEGWNWYQNSNSAGSSDKLYAALDAADGGDLAAAQTALDDLAATGTGQYPLLAQFKDAAIQAKQGNTAEAVSMYDNIVNTAPDQRVRELAMVLGAMILVDTGTQADVEGRVGSINTEDNPLRNSAREAIGLAQFKAGDLLGARTTFQAVIDDPLAPQQMVQRMQIYVAQLIAEGAQTPEEQAAIEAAAATANQTAPDQPAADVAVVPSLEDLSVLTPDILTTPQLSGWLPEGILAPVTVTDEAPVMTGLSPWITGSLPSLSGAEAALAPIAPAGDLDVLSLPAGVIDPAANSPASLSPWVTGPLP